MDILLDVIYVGGAVLFFGLSWAFVQMCARLRPVTDGSKH